MNGYAAFAARHGRRLALPIGLALAAAFAPANISNLAFLCPAALFLLWDGVSPREAAWRGFLFTAGTFFAGTYWIYHSVHLVGGAPTWVALFLMAGLVCIMGSYSAALGYALQRWLPAEGPLRWLLALPAGWVLAEWLRGWMLSGFPWLALGYSQFGTPLRGFAPVLGVYGVSLAVAMTAGGLVMLWRGSALERWAAVVVTVAIWLTGTALDHIRWTQPVGGEISVALVQGAVPQSMKWQPGQLERTMKLYRDLSAPYLGAGIILWPEAAIPALESDIREYLDSVRSEAASHGSSLVLGLVRRDPRLPEDFYNGIVAFSPDEQWYHKRRLVPFGEYFPVPALLRRWLRLMNLPYSDFRNGSSEQSPLAAAGQRLAPTICYEDAYGAEQIALARQSTLLVNVSNDAWFGDSTAPHQHLDISRMRAIEAGRPMLRATNDGVTALIGYDGTVLAFLPQFRPGVLSGSVQPRTGMTPYLRAGNLPLLALLMLGLLVPLLVQRRNAR